MSKQWKRYLKARVFSEDFVEIMVCANLVMLFVSCMVLLPCWLFHADLSLAKWWPVAHLCAMFLFVAIKMILKTKKAILQDYAEWEYKQDRKEPDSNKNI